MTTSDIVNKYLESEIERLQKKIQDLEVELEYSPVDELMELSKQPFTMAVLKKKQRLMKKFDNRRCPTLIIHEKVETAQIINFLSQSRKFDVAKLIDREQFFSTD